MSFERHARLFRNGRNQALRIPKDFELPGDEVILRQEGSCLIVEPLKKKNKLASLLSKWQPLKEEFPEIQDLPADDIDI